MDFTGRDLNEYNISFIEQGEFERHVAATLKTYNCVLNGMNLKKFNSNVVDPIKLTFDKVVFNKSWKEIIMLEIHRQIDKTNNNAIGYFHQNLFSCLPNCEVPKKGFDVIVAMQDGHKICVEIKNKHNTMNSNSSQKTYINMLSHLLKNPKDECYLVEVLAPKSRNINWEITVDDIRHSNERIRRLSIDQFYKIVTGIDDAFYQICRQLPITIEKLVEQNSAKTAKHDTVIQELSAKNPDLLKALYLLAFESYLGFEYGMDDALKAISEYAK